MKQEKAINNYLYQIEKQLSDLSVADRAQAILMAKEEIEQLGQGNPFRIAGSPHARARRIRQELGYSAQPPRTFGRRWLLAFLFLLTAIFAGPLIFLYTWIMPFFNFDYSISRFETSQLAKDLTEDLNQNFSGDFFSISDSDYVETPINLVLSGPTGNIEVAWSSGLLFERECHFQGSRDQVRIENNSIDVSNTVESFRCIFTLPKGSIARVRLSNGMVRLNQPSGDSFVLIDKGRIELSPLKDETYDSQLDAPSIKGTVPKGPGPRLDLKVQTGKIQID